MAVAYDARRATTDVDAVFVPSKEVRIAASRVVQERGLEEDWLNDGVKGFLPGEDVEQVGVFEGTNPRRGRFAQVLTDDEVDDLTLGARDR
jgi:hypothetical protein